MKKSLLLLLSLFWTLGVLAQPVPPAELAGRDLRLWLIQNWYSPYHTQLGYDGSTGARSRMYNFIDNEATQNKVACVYAGYEVNWTYGGSGTNPAPINCEHTVPQSFFAQAEPMRSDLHHLFPSYGNWNSTRSNFPFAEIDDTETDKWMYLDQSQTTVPATNINAYSEFSDNGSSRFEPREDHKGNLARAVFYFYTMYEDVAGLRPMTDVADPALLYQWHLQDPVDAREQERNNRIAQYQGNRNPYVDHPASLAKAWGFAPACDSGPTTQVTDLILADATHNTLSIRWTSGNRDARLVVVREAEAPTLTPSGTYTGVSPDFSQATDQGSGNKVCFTGGGNSMTLSGLAPLTTYYVQVFEFCSATQQYLTTEAPLVYITTAETPPAPVSEGWKITAVDGQYLIDFDRSHAGVNEGPFASAGFTPDPTAGQLDSDSWAITGFSDPELVFGGSQLSGDYAMGFSTGGPTSGGIYAFEVASGNRALGIQPVGSDFTPGTITLRFKNTTGQPISEINLAYNIWVHNNDARANAFNFSHAADGISFTEEPTLDFTSGEAADGSPSWQSNSRSLVISGLSVADGDYYYFRWSGADVSGAGARDEFALDNIRMTVNGTPFCSDATLAATNAAITSMSSNSLDLSWTRGDGEGCIILAKEGAPVDVLPEDGITYTASDAFGEGDEVGDGNFVVYNGTGTGLTLSNLRSSTRYHFLIVESGCSVYLNSSTAAGEGETAALSSLNYFRGSRHTAGVLLEWASSTESNLVNYILERSLDGTSFTSLTTVAAAGNSTTERSYQFVDAASDVDVYYRLRFQGSTGEIRFSEVLHLTQEALGIKDSYASKLITLSPNPSSGVVRLQANAAFSGTVQLQLHSLQGTVLLQTAGALTEVNKELNKQIVSLPAGTYLLLLKNEAGQQAIRLLKQ